MHILDVLFPPVCTACGAIGAYLCQKCSQDIVPFSLSICPVCDRPSHAFRTHTVCQTEHGLDGFIVCTLYNEPIRSYIGALKYGGIKNAGTHLQQILQQCWPRDGPPIELLLPIPLHPKKRQARGYNQAEILARALCECARIPLNTTSLLRIRNSPAQAEKKKEERVLLEQPFLCISPSEVAGKVIGIVDDVATTRTTLQRASEALKDAGAKETWGVVLAHPY